MAEAPRLAIDAMGGDEGLAVMLAGVALARQQRPHLHFDLVGNAAAITAALADHPLLHGAVEIIDAPETIDGNEKPSQAIRRARTTSMGLAIDAVKQGRAGAAVSAGNTGALMAMAKLALRTMPGIDRPALAALLPSLGEKDFVMLDLGANTSAMPAIWLNLPSWARPIRASPWALPSRVSPCSTLVRKIKRAPMKFGTLQPFCGKQRIFP